MGLLSLLLAIFFIYASTSTFASIVEKDTLTPFQRFKDGQTLVSANRRFVLGFFSPFSQTTKRYLGIWYKDITPLTVVWVANRTKPLKNFGAALMLYFNGSLALQDQACNLVLLVMPGKKVGKPVLQLLDSGNLILKDDIDVFNGGYIWQSFDYPCDTLLPGMKIGWNYNKSQNWVIMSWKNNDDPSLGGFTLGLEKSQLPQLVLETNLTKQSRWGPWDGVRFSGTNALESNQIFKTMLNFNGDGAYFTFDVLDESVLVMLVVTQLGKVEFLTWKNCTSQWIPTVTLNKDTCDGYGSCGPYGVCHIDEPTCQCLKGFTTNSSGDWSMMDYSDGCKRNFELKCSDGDGFVKYEGLKLPDNAIVWPNLGSTECEKKCLNECSCMGYTCMDVFGNGSTCIVWLNELLDMRSFSQGGDDLYIRMARKELELISSTKMDKFEIWFSDILSLIAIGMALLAFIAVCIFSKIKCVKRQVKHESNSSRDSNGTQEENPEVKLFDIDLISTATNNFASDNKIGEGGFGPVFKGELPSGQLVAVKRLSRNSQQGLEEFGNEASLIARLQHRNLVKLFGGCVHEDERMLVYEYLPNESLNKFIFDEARKRLLPWAKRFNIIIGVAKGLVYLHDDSRLRVVHRDLKASNILLDSEMMPKISDFGLAKILEGENMLEEPSVRVNGTHGYMSPEYVLHGQISTKLDVFSFGVLVLETISGVRNWGFLHPDHDLNLLGHVWKLWRDGRALEVVDPVLEDDSISETEILRCIQVGLLCAQHRYEVRPTMSTVLIMLSSQSIELPEPMEPGFYLGYSSMRFGSYSRQISGSANGLTVTTLSAR
ncbi:unnamed protein product [Camellia sinensis]